MSKFNVIHFNINANKFEAYNVIPYLLDKYAERIKRHNECPDSKYFQVPVTFDEFKKFVKDESLYQFWGRCEYEIILSDWPSQKTEEKWDIYDQIMMNLDIITRILIDNINFDNYK